MGKKTQKTSDLEKFIIEAIKDSGMNQARLGAMSGIDQGTISHFLNGERTLTLPVADRLCKLLGLKLVRGSKRSRRAQLSPSSEK